MQGILADIGEIYEKHNLDKGWLYTSNLPQGLMKGCLSNEKASQEIIHVPNNGEKHNAAVNQVAESTMY